MTHFRRCLCKKLFVNLALTWFGVDLFGVAGSRRHASCWATLDDLQMFDDGGCCNADATGPKAHDAAEADLEAGAAPAPAPAPAVTESKSRWLASRLSRMVHSQPAARSDVEAPPHPEAAAATAEPIDEAQGSSSMIRSSIELSTARQADNGAPLAARSGQRKSLQEPAVHGATRSERIDALTEHTADGGAGSDGAQPVALISAVQTRDGRLVVDSIAAGGRADRPGETSPGVAATPAIAAIGSGATATQHRNSGHAESGGAGGSGPSSLRVPSETARAPWRGILQRLHLRPQPSAADTDNLPVDVP